MNNSKIFHSEKGENSKNAYHTPLEHKVNIFLTPFQKYINSQVTASVFLFVCALIALIWASIPTISGWYTSFITASIGFHISDFIIAKPLRFWVNDFLLTLFFFFVGLEIKREFLVGELTNHKKALFVLSAAIGGMVLPACIYFLLNIGTPNQQGWGIPIATDTAFALGVLFCFKSKVSKSAFAFLAALAIIDDIGAIIIIAIFYTPHLNIWMLSIAFFLLTLLILLNYSGFRKPWPYIAIGLLVWASIEGAGIHGTVSGILVAFIIPARPGRGPRQFLDRIRTLLSSFEKNKEDTPLILEDQNQHAVLEKVQEITQQATTPLQRWESKLELPIALIILPLFALTNAGIPVDLQLIGSVFTNRISLGILLGLIIGKPLGILLFSQIGLWLKLGKMSKEINFQQLIGVSILTGIGFTMSLFIADLSFSSEKVLLEAKAAILMASIIAGLSGVFFISISSRQAPSS